MAGVLTKNELFKAVREGDISRVEQLTKDLKDDLKCEDDYGNTLLHTAAEGGHVEMFVYLTEQGLDPLARNSRRMTVLHKACISGKLDMISYLRKIFPFLLFWHDNCLWTPLHFHCYYSNNVEIFKYLLDQGLDVYSVTKSGDTVLHKACMGAGYALAQYLVQTFPKLKGDVNKYGHTVLYAAVRGGNVELFRWLVEQGCDVNALTTKGRTVLHHACEVDSHDLVKYLVDKHPHLMEKVDMYKNTALHAAAKRGNVEIFKLLVTKGLDVYSLSNGKKTVLHKAASHGKYEMVQYLVTKYPDLMKMKAINGETALLRAAENKHDQIIKHLIDKGMDPDDSIAALSGDMETSAAVAYLRKYLLLKQPATILTSVVHSSPDDGKLRQAARVQGEVGEGIAGEKLESNGGILLPVPSVISSGVDSGRHSYLDSHSRPSSIGSAEDGPNSHAQALKNAEGAKQMEEATVRAMQSSEEAVTLALRNVYYMAKEDQANNTLPGLNELLRVQGVSAISGLKVDNHTSYSSHSSVEEFQTAIADVLNDDLHAELARSPHYSLMIDESTDVSNSQNLLVYVRFLSKREGDVRQVSRTVFLGLRRLEEGATADKITGEVLGVLEDHGLDVQKLSGIATDGAAVMVGCKSGVVTRFKEIVPGLVGTHCIAHRLALGAAAAADSILYLVKYQEVLNAIFKYFDNSPKNLNKLQAVQKILSMDLTRLKQVFHTRWLSFEGAVRAIMVNFAALVTVLTEDKGIKAQSITKPIATYKFLHVTHFMCDVLHHLCILSKAYQGSDVSFDHVHPLLAATLVQVKALQESNGPSLTRFLSSVPAVPEEHADGTCSFSFQGHCIRDSMKQRQEAKSACSKYLENVIDSLSSRFSEQNDSSVLLSLSKVLSPEGLSDIGKCEADVCELVKYVCEMDGTCDKEEIKLQFDSFATYFKCSPISKSASTVADICELGIRHSDVYPVIADLCVRFLVAPVTTVDCERGFSRHNLIKTKTRNSLAAKSTERLMIISSRGPPLNEFKGFSRAFRKWAIKNRRILK